MPARSKSRVQQINIGLSEERRVGTIELLHQDLTNVYLLLIKTKTHHWDVAELQ